MESPVGAGLHLTDYSFSSALARITMAGLALPGIALPGIALAGIALPGVALPRIALAGIALPGIALPGIALPGIALRPAEACLRVAANWGGLGQYSNASSSFTATGRMLSSTTTYYRAERILGGTFCL